MEKRTEINNEFADALLVVLTTDNKEEYKNSLDKLHKKGHTKNYLPIHFSNGVRGAYDTSNLKINNSQEKLLK